MKAIIGGAVLWFCLSATGAASAADYYLVGLPKDNSFVEFLDAGTLNCLSSARLSEMLRCMRRLLKTSAWSGDA